MDLSPPTTQVQASSESLLLKKLLNASKADVQSVVKRGFDADMLDKVHQPVAKYMLEHINKYGTTPGEDLMRQQQPSYSDLLAKIPVAKASISAIYDAVISDATRSAVTEYVQEIGKEWETMTDGPQMLDFMEHTFSAMRRKFSMTQDTSVLFSGMADQLVEDYLESKNPQRRGIPIPIYHVYNSIGSFELSQVTTVVAKSSVGKTFLLQKCADAAIHGDPFRFYQPPNEPLWTPEQKDEAAVKTILCSFEMSAIDIARRQSALMSKISFNRIRSGKLEQDEEKSYMDFLRCLASGGDSESTKIGSRLRILGPESVSTPMQIDAQADDFGADMVILDGFYLMDGPGDKRWEAVQENMKQIRLNSLRSNRHYLLASQLDTKSSTKSASNLDNLSFSASIVHDSNNIIFMTQTADQKRAKTVDFALGKARDGQILDPCTYQWDWVNMQLAEIGFANSADSMDMASSSPALAL